MGVALTCLLGSSTPVRTSLRKVSPDFEKDFFSPVVDCRTAITRCYVSCKLAWIGRWICGHVRQSVSEKGSILVASGLGGKVKRAGLSIRTRRPKSFTRETIPWEGGVVKLLEFSSMRQVFRVGRISLYIDVSLNFILVCSDIPCRYKYIRHQMYTFVMIISYKRSSSCWLESKDNSTEERKKLSRSWPREGRIMKHYGELRIEGRFWRT